MRRTGKNVPTLTRLTPVVNGGILSLTKDIDDQSDTYGGDHYVNQRFSISGDLMWNTVRVDRGATTVETNPQ